MAYKLDKSTGDIVINGFENGIADDPFAGISNLVNTNLISIPKEASVNFSTSKISGSSSNGNVTSADAGADTVTITGDSFDSGTAIVFSGASLPAGITAGTIYWTFGSSGVYQLFDNYARTSLVNITGTGTGTWATVNMGQPKYFTHLLTPYVDTYFMVDGNGRVWSNMFPTQNFNYWTYTGNSITGTNGTAHGNGLISYVPSDSASSAIGYIFVFRDFQIDYATITSNTTLAWTYGWKPSTGETGKNNYLKNASTGSFTSLSHETFLAPDNVVYYCDGAYIGRFYEQTGQAFNPTTGSPNPTTYISDETRLLPFTDAAQCLSFLGTNLLIGGKENVIYPWDTTSPTFSYPILLSEYNVQKMVTVNTNTFIFVGNRGRIYYTNGTNAQLYKKIPDHLSNTVEPYFTWGGACSVKNQLYFSTLAKTNSGTALTTYGGLWAIDLITKSIRLSNTLSYQSTVYNGYATALIPNFSTNPAGTGLFIGWDSNSSTYGIDTTISAPYSGSTAVAVAIIDSDLIPIGTFLKPTTSGRVEYKLSMPLVSGETVSMWYRQKFSDSFTQIGSTTTYSTNGAGTTYSDVFQNLSFEKSQWIQLRAVLTSTASSPSYNRMTEMRIGQ